MTIAALLTRWLEVLARLWLGWLDSRRASHTLLISPEDGKLVVCHIEPGRKGAATTAKGKRTSVLARIDPGKTAPGGIRSAARRSQVVFELPADKVVTRRITVPAQARELLPGIVANQIERLSPWQAEQAVHGFDAEKGAEPGSALDVRVLIGERAAVDGALSELSAIGLPADRVVAGVPDAQAIGTVTLWSRLAHASKESVAHTSRRIGVGLAGIVGLSLCLTLWAMVSASSLRGEGEAAAARYKALQKQVQAGRSPQALASLDPPERAWAAREGSPSAVILLEALSRALPDQAYLTELRLDKGTLRISGLAGDAPSLVAPLEQTGHLTSVRFFAPTTLAPDGRLSRFHIEARVEPRLKIKEQ